MTRSKTWSGIYVRREMWMRGILRKSMTEELVSLTDDESASMRWTIDGFYCKIYVDYGLQLVGWPHDEFFTDLSSVTGLERISRLFELWVEGVMRFEPVDLDIDARRARKPEDVAPSPLHLDIAARLGRSDLKKRKGSSKIDPARFPARYVRNGPKSEKWVTAAAEARAEAAAVALEGAKV
ncbi:hypothetical protein PYCCODRAFT_1200795 [Trametes coccinea BRFM310]|uniref:Uncharacterized protein n=1 Tax=Trametes coccinea (strain BRFM310) TaxID=1353009 RepID=A0A1Y2I518_TRAC3|nr:hypothetical protein PYCCODRAFT_155427 [Trametes coccinea BRFM310]OSC97009.1 hypothetical protein PYCCODRAFT_1200795 [Trametes coccinea BRFM310]